MEILMNIRIENLLPTSKGDYVNLEILDSEVTSKISGGATIADVLYYISLNPPSPSSSDTLGILRP
jgi:hypothetical protein